jgi:hypothetical protein
MSLLSAMTQPTGTLVNGAPQFYFALDSTPADPTVTAPDFVATGAGATPVGNFDARGNGTAPFPAEMFTLSTSAGTPQFSMGLLNVPTGVGSVGNDFAISRYDDNGGYQGAQLTINRATGLVSIANSLSVATDISCNTAGVASALTVGTAATVGGGSLEINGTLGVGTVFDSVYNPAVASQTDYLEQDTVAFPAIIPAGISSYAIGPLVTLPKSGLYLVSGVVSYNGIVASTFTSAAGDFVAVIMVPTPAGPLTGGVNFDLSPVPAGAVQIDRNWENVSVAKLTGGAPYQPTLFIYNLSGTMAASAGSTLDAFYDIAALC